MAFRFGYFDSDIVGVDEEGMPIFDRAETSDLFALLFAHLVSDGVLAFPSDCFMVRAAGNGLNLELAPGFGVIKGHFCYDDEIGRIFIEAAPQTYSRIDRVVMRCNYIQRMIEIIIKTGAEAANPVPPDLLRPTAGDYYELCLAEIRLSPGQKLITQSNITDTRLDSSVCGLITQLIDHLDTEIFSAQLNSWYQNMTDQAEQDLENWFIQFTAWFDQTRQEFAEAVKDAKEKADLANTAAVRLNKFITDMEEQITAGYFNGPQGAQGIQGPKGDKGDRGDSGILVPVSGIFTLSGDEEGNLWAYFADEDNPPSFVYDEETGDVYYDTPEV
jgi:hypothetical protein